MIRIMASYFRRPVHTFKRFKCASCIILKLGLLHHMCCTNAMHLYMTIIIIVGEKDLNILTKKMLDDRKAKPPEKGDETLLDLFISFSDDEEVQLADALEFAIFGQYCLEYCKTYLSMYLTQSARTNNYKSFNLVN